MTLSRVERCFLRLFCCVLPLLAAGLIGELYAGWCRFTCAHTLGGVNAPQVAVGWPCQQSVNEVRAQDPYVGIFSWHVGGLSLLAFRSKDVGWPC